MSRKHLQVSNCGVEDGVLLKDYSVNLITTLNKVLYLMTLKYKVVEIDRESE